MESTHPEIKLDVEVCESVPLTQAEKAVFAPCLEERGLAADFLDIVTNIPNRTRVIKVYSPDRQMLGLTTVLLTPQVFMKHCFGQGNHIGTNNTFFFAEQANRSAVLKAVFGKLLELRPAGLYIGLIEESWAADFKPALDGLQYQVAGKVLEAGSISTASADAVEKLMDSHEHLSRQINRFRNKGGTVHIHEGAVSPELGEAFVKCCKESYQKNPHPGAPINVELYGEHVREFMLKYPSALYVYARMDEQVTGVQIFIKHRRYLELTEGGFLSDTFHAYENIIIASVRYAVEHGLEKVSYGLILNPAKDRLMDKNGRKPIFMITLRSAAMPPAGMGHAGMGHMGGAGHEQFPELYWRERSLYPDLPL